MTEQTFEDFDQAEPGDSAANAQSFADFRDSWPEGQEWEVDFDGGPTRTTSLSWIAYRATQDPDAEVTPL